VKRISNLSGAHPEEGAGPYRITDHEFGLFQALVQQETGIQLPEAKRLLLVGRLARRLRALKLESFGAYYQLATGDGDELIRMIDLVSTNETHFFREPKQFEFLERQLLPAWVGAAAERRGRVRAWSTACSTGEEPYSIAMTLLSRLPGWDIEVFATDLSTRVLETARAAVWPIEKSRAIPERHLKAFMLRGTGEHQGYMKAGPELRGMVRFERLNLHDARYEADGFFDLIFCRNVLIYFSAEGRAAVVKKLLDRLAPGGHLFLGHAETLNGITDRLRSVGPTVYSWAEREGSLPAARTFPCETIPVVNGDACPARGQAGEPQSKRKCSQKTAIDGAEQDRDRGLSLASRAGHDPRHPDHSCDDVRRGREQGGGLRGRLRRVRHETPRRPGPARQGPQPARDGGARRMSREPSRGGTTGFDP